MKTVLIAAAPAATDIIAVALRNVARLVTARTIDEAIAIIKSGVDLIVAGTFFDESRMFDLLHQVKSDANLCDIPFLCVRGISAPLATAALSPRPLLASHAVVDSATKALGAVGYVDLCERRLDLGDEAANAELAALVRKYLTPAVR